MFRQKQQVRLIWQNCLHVESIKKTENMFVLYISGDSIQNNKDFFACFSLGNKIENSFNYRYEIRIQKKKNLWKFS